LIEKTRKNDKRKEKYNRKEVVTESAFRTRFRLAGFAITVGDLKPLITISAVLCLIVSLLFIVSNVIARGNNYYFVDTYQTRNKRLHVM
jgi:hypothetical protein